MVECDVEAEMRMGIVLGAGYGRRASPRRLVRATCRYYTPSSGVLTYVPDVPARMVHPAGGMNTNGHIALLKHQLKQVELAPS